MRRAVFLDRDGVLNRVVERDGMAGSPRSIEELALVPEAAAAVARLQETGYLVFAVTNQPDLARGLLDPAAHTAMMAEVQRTLRPDDVRWCPHDDDDECACRKPKPGMLQNLARAWSVDLARSWMVGDTQRDVGAGRAAGCRTVLIRTHYNADTAADHAVASITAAAELILAATSMEQ